MIRRVFTRRERWLLILGIVVGLLGAAATLVQPMLVGRAVESVANNGPLGVTVALLVALLIADLALGALSFCLIGRVGEQVVASMRRVFVHKLMRAQLSGFQAYPQGDLMTRGMADTAVARLALSTSLAQVITSAFTALGCFVVMAFIDWQLLLATLAALALASVACLLLSRRIRRQSVQNREDTSAFGNELLRVLSNVSTVKACGNEDAEERQLGKAASKARDSGNRVISTSSLMTPAMNVGTQAALLIVVAWGMSRALSGQMTMAELSAFVMYVLYVVAPLVMLFMGIAELQQARAAVDRLDEVLELPEESGGDQLPDEDATESVRFDQVTFTYPGATEPALRQVNLTLPRTGMTAIVGASGGGKSTMFGLIERFNDPDSGSVELAGVDVREMPLQQLRSWVGLVEQDSPLMRGTIGSNLRYGAPDASDETVRVALEQAQLADVVDGLPLGLDTPLAEEGVGLSGGQRQRLAIARTLVRQPQLLLLDEVTANLDSESEESLNQAMQAAAGHRQVLVIAHRMSTVRSADHILVVRDGQVVGSGTHQDLYATNADYRRLARTQLEQTPQPEAEAPVLAMSG